MYVYVAKNARILHFSWIFFLFEGGGDLHPSPTPMAGPQAPYQLNPAVNKTIITFSHFEVPLFMSARVEG